MSVVTGTSTSTSYVAHVDSAHVTSASVARMPPGSSRQTLRALHRSAPSSSHCVDHERGPSIPFEHGVELEVQPSGLQVEVWRHRSKKVPPSQSRLRGIAPSSWVDRFRSSSPG